jgi:hypothetical protein
LERPKKYKYRKLCHGNFVPENSIYDTKWGAHTLGTFSSFGFTFRLLVFRFLWLGIGGSFFCRFAESFSFDRNVAYNSTASRPS